jgi:hypothetical protein
MMMDVFSRKVTAWEVHDIESGEHAANLIFRVPTDNQLSDNIADA